jgi:DNA-binding CsgD family transcriptional regulator
MSTAVTQQPHPGLRAEFLDRRLARRRAVKSLELFTSIDDRRGAGYARCVVADCLTSEGNPADGLATLQTCIGDFEALLDRWGLLISTISAALAHAALADWRQTAFVLGVAESLSERIGGQPFPGVQAVLDAITAKTAAELGAPAALRHEAGRAVGRGDRIAAPLGLAPEPARSYPPQQQLPLTRREHEVTELIAEGLTNRQIAQRLFIAQRTVDTHVGHILAKLGCSTRSQAVALTSARRPPAPPA